MESRYAKLLFVRFIVWKEDLPTDSTERISNQLDRWRASVLLKGSFAQEISDG